MKVIALVLLIGLLSVSACSDDEPAAERDPGKAAMQDEAALAKQNATTITAGDSEFGTMLFDSRDQAIYVFENDRDGRTVCYGECAEAWPPVFTEAEPEAGEGVDASLLGTVKRRGGKLQVTYAGKPLYFYAHEEPGEVKCHNVNLNGGFWWVLGPDGARRT
jgi:predicted lipoprotein with Yx(FWY)xxD motif